MLKYTLQEYVKILCKMASKVAAMCNIFLHISVLLLFTHYSQGQTGQLCQDGWSVYSGRCYLKVHKSVKYSTARSNCEEKGATLATISNDNENDFLLGLARSTQVWIGLTRAQHNCSDGELVCQRTNWMWADDTPYRYPGWHKWRNRDPQSDEHCARLVPDHRAGWFGKPCDDPYAYICEKASPSKTCSECKPVITTSTAIPMASIPVDAVTSPSLDGHQSTSYDLLTTVCSSLHSESEINSVFIAVSSVLAVSLLVNAVTAIIICRQRSTRPPQKEHENVVVYENQSGPDVKQPSPSPLPIQPDGPGSEASMYTGLQGVVPESEQASVNESEIQYEALQRAGQVMDYDYVNPSRDM